MIRIVSEASQASYDTRTPVTAHSGLAVGMYREFFEQVDSVLNVAAGNTHLHADLELRGIPLDVTAVDPTYERVEVVDGDAHVPGVAQALPFEDDTFGLTMCQFGLQHVSDADMPAAVDEMIRVTRPTTPEDTSANGSIVINPVFKPEKLRRALSEAGLDGVVATVIHHDVDNIPYGDRKNVEPTLAIQKNRQLTSDIQQKLVEIVVSTGALKPSHRSLGEMVCRLGGGQSKR